MNRLSIYNNKNKSKKHHVEQKDQIQKECILHAFMYKKCKNRCNSSVELEVKILAPFVGGEG